MATRNCRLCRFPLSIHPSIKLKNIPRGGHVLPKYEQLETDTGVDLEVYQCENCGLVQLTAESLVYADQVGSAHASSPGMLSHRKRQAYELVEQFNLRDKTILEVGCGDGHFMEFFAEAGAIPFGVEPSERSTELGRKHGLKIKQGYMSKNAKIEGAPFDAFVTMHVLEHAPDPNDFLQGIYENLTPNGVGFIEVPSFEQTLENERIYDFITDHLHYFSVKTLRFALEKNDFKVLDIKRDWGGEHIVATVQKQERESLANLQTGVDFLIQKMWDFINAYSFQGKRVAIWGASTNGVTLLSLAQFKGIVYVVDSSPHKQNRFTPVSHWPILDPSHLKTDPVDAIMVMATRFTDEIVNQIKTEIGFTGTIAVLKGNSLEVVQTGKEV
ncbi:MULTISPECIES: class I SAM-dependent methyltransferase [Kamptonema]|uniref:class I SAM-dependent methyltransferase n=1 Tax=Kamptonema TaxID=1501433 RepID=UPI0001DAD00E|nr:MULTISPECIES: class I SAM-dependent methyltransferase [Kamptonema]CBN55136.1 putative methyltransferase [Kamptonema sp. PCC 6506]